MQASFQLISARVVLRLSNKCYQNWPMSLVQLVKVKVKFLKNYKETHYLLSSYFTILHLQELIWYFELLPWYKETTKHQKAKKIKTALLNTMATM